MTTTYSTDAEVRLRSTLADPALAAVNVARARQSLAALALDDFRVSAQAEILRALRRRGIEASDITRPDDLQPAECALAVALLCEAAAQRPASSAASGAPLDVYAQNAEHWRRVYDTEVERASPIDSLKGTGRGFAWSRG